MKTLKSLIQKYTEDFKERPDLFKKDYSKKMGGTQTVVIEGVGSFYFDDREYYSGRGKMYNRDSMHDHLGEVFVSKDEFYKKVEEVAHFWYKVEKDRAQAKREFKESYNKAAELIGKERLDEGIELIKQYSSKVYLFIDNVQLFHAYHSDSISIDIISEERRKEFDWDDWYSAPYASRLGMSENNKNLFIC